MYFCLVYLFGVNEVKMLIETKYVAGHEMREVCVIDRHLASLFIKYKYMTYTFDRYVLRISCCTANLYELRHPYFKKLILCDQL